MIIVYILLGFIIGAISLYLVFGANVLEIVLDFLGAILEAIFDNWD